MAPGAITWSNIQSICVKHKAFVGTEIYLKPFVDNFLDWPTVQNLNSVAKDLKPDFPWVFIQQERVPRRAKSRGQASLSGYVALIGMQGKIPVRESNAHDFLNCLSFLLFPKSKLELNLRHHRECPNGLKSGENRTRTQDLLTVFDEGGVIRLLGGSGVIADLVFGHAVYEHIVLGKRVRAARMDLTTTEKLTDCNYCDLYKIADELFAEWLKDPNNCRHSEEFSSIWIDP